MKKLVLILICLIFFNSFSQSVNDLEIKVENLSNNGQPVNYCSTIDLGSNISSTISLWVNLRKPHAQTVGVSDLDIYIIGTYGQRNSQFHVVIYESQWYQGDDTHPDTFMQYCSFIINSSDFNNSGGSLFGVFKSSGNIEYQTECNYSIIKTLSPSFSLNPSNISIACGDTSSKTFSVSQANVPSGSTVTYQWSYNGWSGNVNTSMSSITLSPTSGSSLPSNVSVTPYINGVAKPTLTCLVSRAPLSTSATISGSDSICSPSTSSNYSLTGVLAGQNVTWSSSNTAIATVSSNGNNVTVNKQTNGTFNLIATISNSCGQTTNIIKNIRFGGVPNFTYTLTSSYNYAFVNLTSTDATPIQQQGITSVIWKKTDSTNDGTGNGNGFSGIAHGPNYGWSVTFLITATNLCGTTTIEAYVDCAPPPPCDENPTLFLVNDNNQITPKMVIEPCNSPPYPNTDKKSDDTSIQEIEIFDLMGMNVGTSNSSSIDGTSLVKGIYVVRVKTNQGIFTNKIKID